MATEFAGEDKPATRAPWGSPAVGSPVPHAGRPGFLPIETNGFDRVFISVVCFVAIHLLWMRFVEAFLPLAIATALSLVLAVLIVRYG